MAWTKIPAENHAVFSNAIPKDPRVSTLKMFGGIAAIANGHMFAGLFGRSFMVKLSEADRARAMKLDGAEPFDPMANGRIMKDTIFMPESAMDDARELRDWLRSALRYVVTLPTKTKTARTPRPARPKRKPARRA